MSLTLCRVTRTQFIIQSVMTTLLAIFTTRWLLPTLYIFRSPYEASHRLITPTAMAVTACLTAFFTGAALTRPQQHSYYMGMILWWAAIPLALLFWGTAGFVYRMPLKTGKAVFAITLAIPTGYLWACDLFALKRGTWHINELTSFNLFPIPQLPVEEMVFFFLTNLLLVIASFTFDRCIALGRLQIGVDAQSSSTVTPPFSPSYLPLNLTTIKALWGTFIVQDPDPMSKTQSATSSQAQVADLQASLRILSRASKSFSLAALLFPWDLRSDLSMLYGFCRAADDFVDEGENDGDVKVERLKLLHDLVDAIYDLEDPHASIRAVLASYRIQDTAANELSDLRASASSVVSLCHLVPRSLWLELLQGYQRDLDLDLRGYDARFETMDDLVEYGQCVAGCVGEMCVRVVLGRCGVALDESDAKVDRRIPLRRSGGKWSLVENDKQTSSLLYNARRMGVALQLVNIARDIVQDSIDLKRCYLPLDLFEDGGQEKIQALFKSQVNTKQSLTALTLRPQIYTLLDISSKLYHASLPSLAYFSHVSRPVESGLRVACGVYFAIAHCILSQSNEDMQRGERVRLSVAKRMWIALRCVYGF